MGMRIKHINAGAAFVAPVETRRFEMKDLLHDIINIIKHNRDGSFGTQAKRKQVLMRAFKLILIKFRGLKLAHVKSMHFEYLVNEVWKDLAHGTIKSNLSQIRWLLEKIKKTYLLPARNDSLGIPRRTIVAKRNKSWLLKVDIAKKIAEVWEKDKTAGLFLESCVYLGLRFEEAAPFRPHENIKITDHGQMVEIVYGTKGGRRRMVNIVTPEQEALLDVLKRTIKLGLSLVPISWTYEQFKNRMYYVLRNCGITKKNGLTVHGLRHTYSCRRYKAITGESAPIIKKTNGCSTGEKLHHEKDMIARKIIAEELGHGRVSVTSSYIGGRR